MPKDVLHPPADAGSISVAELVEICRLKFKYREERKIENGVHLQYISPAV